MDTSPAQVTSEKPQDSQINVLIIIFLICITALVLVGGYFYFRSKQTEELVGVLRMCDGEESNGQFLSDGQKQIVPPSIVDLKNNYTSFRFAEGGGSEYRNETDTYYFAEGDKKAELLSVQGAVSKVNAKTGSVCIFSNGINRKLDFTVKPVETFIVKYEPPDGYSGTGPYVPRMVTTPASWEDIEVGDIVTYNIPNSFSTIERILIDKKERNENN